MRYSLITEGSEGNRQDSEFERAEIAAGRSSSFVSREIQIALRPTRENVRSSETGTEREAAIDNRYENRENNKNRVFIDKRASVEFDGSRTACFTGERFRWPLNRLERRKMELK